MLLDDPRFCDHRRVVVVAACLTAMTLLTLVDLLSSRSPTGNESLKFPQPHSDPSKAGSGNGRYSEFMSALKSAQDDVVAAAVLLESAFQQADESIATATKSLEAFEHEMLRQQRVHDRLQAPQQQQQQGGPNDSAEQQKAKNQRHRSGYLQFFESIKFCEKLISSRLETKSISHHEKRAWRQRIMGVLHQADTFTLDGVAGQRGKVEALEAQVTIVLSKWGRHFSKTANEAPAPETRVLELAEVGYEPIYHGLFAPDATSHPSDAEGQKLHQLYNTQPQ